MGSKASVDRRTDSSDHRNKTKTGPDGGNPCLIKSVGGLCVGGIRTASGLYVIASLILTFFGGALTSLTFCFSLWPGKKPNLGWAALSTFFAFLSAYGLYCAVTNEGYLFGI
ncbi:MAG: hypothetical protein B7Y47_08230 [Sphingomonas sp. 28-63-12]|nr:MAG: hypothetical protein B7Y47_08230 [Sphingomonas sp. 28-63-12]